MNGWENKRDGRDGRDGPEGIEIEARNWGNVSRVRCGLDLTARSGGCRERYCTVQTGLGKRTDGLGLWQGAGGSIAGMAWQR